MPPDMAIDMRRTKLKASEAALLAGELTKPSWESRNEGIHERVSFEDSIWGFDLAGGSYYKTPLRVVAVKPDSRAEKAGIRPGDKLKRINDIDTSTLTIQEAHEIIIESGIHLKLAVTAPEDEEDAYFCYEDPLANNGYDSDEERRNEEARAKKRQVHARVSSYWSLQWPWVSKRRVIYRESNCFMVPSKFEDKHRDKFTPQPVLRIQDDIVLQNLKDEKLLQDDAAKQKEAIKENATKLVNQPVATKENATSPVNQSVAKGNTELKSDDLDKNIKLNESLKASKATELNGNLGKIAEVEEESIQEDTSISTIEDLIDDSNIIEENLKDEGIVNNENHTLSNEVVCNHNEEIENDESSIEVEENAKYEELVVGEIITQNEEPNTKDDDIINEVLEKVENGFDEENIIDSILSDSEENNLEHSESER